VHTKVAQEIELRRQIILSSKLAGIYEVHIDQRNAPESMMLTDHGKPAVACSSSSQCQQLSFRASTVICVEVHTHNLSDEHLVRATDVASLKHQTQLAEPPVALAITAIVPIQLGFEEPYSPRTVT